MERLRKLIKEVLSTPPPRLNIDDLSKEEFENLMTITGKKPMSLDKILILLLDDGSHVSLRTVEKLLPQLKTVSDINSLNESTEKDSCNCGCHSCENVGNSGVVLNESLVKKDILSENLRYHVDNKLPLTENTFRYGSKAFINLWAEARSLYLREIIHVNDDDKEILEETDLGNYGIYEGKKVLLDMPMLEEELDEAKDKKKTPPIGKPKRGGSKKFYVYVRNPKTKKIKKVSFGDTTGLSVKINDPKARQAFAKRHKCAQATDRTKARYWSCRIGRYWKQLGGAKNFSGFW